MSIPIPEADRFTRRAREVLDHAQAEAAALQHTDVTSAHVLLGLLIEPEGVAARVLRALGVSLDGVRAEVAGAHSANVTPASAAERVVANALVEANQLQHRYVGTEHLLLGLIATRDAETSALLTRLGVAPERARSGVLNMMRTGQPGL